MDGQVNIKYRLLGLFGIFFSLGICSLGLGLLASGKEVTVFLATGSFSFIWVGLGFLGQILINMKTVQVNNNTLTVGTVFGIIKKNYSIDQIVSVNPKSFRNRFSSYPGLLIKFIDGRQTHIHRLEFVNFIEIKSLICSKVDRDRNLKLDIWTPFTKLFVGVCGLILLLIFIFKLMGQ